MSVNYFTRCKNFFASRLGEFEARQLRMRSISKRRCLRRRQMPERHR
jgi:hypothetical protein